MSDFKRDFEADECDMVGLGISLETEFGIEIEPGVEMNWRTVDDVYQHMESLQTQVVSEAKGYGRIAIDEF